MVMLQISLVVFFCHRHHRASICRGCSMQNGLLKEVPGKNRKAISEAERPVPKALS